jgi:membrane fusion protein, multidrug efflux system
MSNSAKHRLFIVISAAVTFATGCGDDKPKAAERETVPVVISTVAQKTVPLQLRAIGNVEALTNVSIKTQISGELRGVHFREGQDVKKGTLLFTIDRRPFEAELSRAEATLAKDEAEAANAKSMAARADKLFDEGVMAREQRDQLASAAESAQATVRADRAAVENARLSLSYTSIYSPITGRTGNLLVHAGNLVKENDTSSVLTTINQISPIYVNFALPERYLPELKKFVAAGKVRVDAMPPHENTPLGQGVVTFIDNAVDATTGTIKVKATFENGDHQLWPGQFVDVVLTLMQQSNAITIPSVAVQTGQQGQYVYVVKSDSTVENRNINVVRTFGQESIIEKGLQPGERVVTDGQLRLQPGARVEIKSGLPASVNGLSSPSDSASGAE